MKFLPMLTAVVVGVCALHHTQASSAINGAHNRHRRYAHMRIDAQKLPSPYFAACYAGAAVAFLTGVLLRMGLSGKILEWPLMLIAVPGVIMGVRGHMNHAVFWKKFCQLQQDNEVTYEKQAQDLKALQDMLRQYEAPRARAGLARDA